MAVGIRGFAAIIAVAALMVIGVACGNGAGPTSLNEEAPTQAPPTVGGETPTALIPLCRNDGCAYHRRREGLVVLEQGDGTKQGSGPSIYTEQ